MASILGKSIGRYHILEQLGQGGMATVYKAYDTRLERDVAIKIIRTELFGEALIERILKRFEREAKVLARLDHTNIVKVHDFGEYENAPYLVMQYVRSGTLKNMTGQPIPYQDAAKLLLPIAQALSYAHENGVLHRDVKPSNILISENNAPVLTDFGIAKLLESEEPQTLTGTGLGVGTPEYMAPEQGIGKEVDGRADIYSLGVVFYELITGQKPYTADTPMAVIIKQIHDPIPRPKDYLQELPDEVEMVLLKGLAKDPENRYQSMAEFCKTLVGLTTRVVLPDEKQQLRRSRFSFAENNGLYDEETCDRIDVSIEDRRQLIPDGSNGTSQEENQKKEKALSKFQKKKTSVWLWIGIVGIIIGLIGILLRGYDEGQLRKFPNVKNTLTITQSSIDTAPKTQTTAKSSIKTATKTITSLSEVIIMPTSTLLPTQKEISKITPTPGIGSTRVIEVDGMVQVYIPVGEFEMGSENGDIDEKPVHTVYLNAFWIDQTEVTNIMYTKCIADGECTKPSTSSSYSRNDYFGNHEYDDYPVINVSWYQAEMYCEWAGRELPTEAQWEKAARWTIGRTYPWGDGLINSHLANFGKYEGDTTRAGSYPDGVSKYGAYDMAGNVWEWVADWYDEDYYRGITASVDNPENIEESSYKILRGGSWSDSGYLLRSAYRLKYIPSKSLTSIGFRCIANE